MAGVTTPTDLRSRRDALEQGARKSLAGSIAFLRDHMPRIWRRLVRFLLLWRGSRRLARIVAVVLVVVVMVPTVAAVLALFGLFDLGAFLGLDEKCGAQDVSCGVFVELLGAILVVGFAFVFLTVWRLHRVVTGGYIREAIDHPDGLVQTATPMPQVVGRDDLCGVIEDDLVGRASRPQLIIGGVGSGKTAVLVQLTRLLAERGAVPVPIHLRAATKSTDPPDLDFHAIARERFLASVDDRLLSEDEGDRIWRKLWKTGLVIVLADGLEEALLGGANADHAGRRRSIRRAVEAAGKKTNMRLLIASRPDDTLADLEAAVVRLEPLNEGDAVKHICESAREDARLDVEWVQRLVGVAAVTEMPLYLSLARDLAELGELEEAISDLYASLSPDAGPASGAAASPEDTLQGVIDTCEGGARLALRLGLLDRWKLCLLEERAPLVRPPPYPQTAVRVSRQARSQAITCLESMAAQALLRNTLELEFETLSSRAEASGEPDLVAADGEQLELVERTHDGVRFRHGIVQAYLGSQVLLASLQRDDGGGLRDALSPEPSRELLMALVMSCFRASDDERRYVRDELHATVTSPSSGKGGARDFELLAAAYEIDGMLSRDGAEPLAGSARTAWDRNGTASGSEGAMAPSGEAKVQEAKLRAIEQIGRARDEKSFEALIHICCKENAYGVRLHAAQALGDGGSGALRALRDQIERAQERCEALRGNDGGEDAELGDVRLLSVQGWVLPMLAATCDVQDRAHLNEHLSAWVGLVSDVHLGAEACLAQGLKFEANRLPRRAADPDVRAFLVDEAVRMMASARWWYSRVALVQALSLWWLDPKVRDERPDLLDTIERVRAEDTHPFVSEAASLCLQIKDDPSPFVWIDEAGTVAHVGPSSGVSNTQSETGLWITPAAGWLTLRPRTQQLLADMFLMLNLVEQGRFEGREIRRRRAAPGSGNGTATHAALPQCLTDPRERTRFGFTNGAQAKSSSHSCAEGCPWGLCPYPEKAERPFRGELSEGFCRRQQTLLRQTHRAPPAWQLQDSAWHSKRRRSALKEFWKSLEQRGRV